MSLEDGVELMKTEAGRRIAEAWRAEAIRILREEGGALDYEVDPIIDSFTNVEETEDGYMFSIEHPAAGFFEYGTTEHTIEPNGEALRFVNEQGDVVFAKEVTVSGVTAILYISKSKQRAQAGTLDF